jgi:hypothetical protein
LAWATHATLALPGLIVSPGSTGVQVIVMVPPFSVVLAATAPEAGAQGCKEPHPASDTA